jgi:DNA-binding phage protein
MNPTMNKLNAPDRAAMVRARLAAMVQADPRKIGEVALASGLSYDHLYQILSGRRRNPSIDTVLAILDGLGKRLADLDP